MDAEGYYILKPNFTNSPKLDLRLWIQNIDNIFSVAGLVFNALLLYMILYHSRKVLRPYKPILLQNCIIDFFYTIVNAITKTHLESKNGWFYGINSGYFEHVKRPWNDCLVFLWIFSLFYAITVVPVPFVYRYYLIVRKKELSIRQYVAMMAPSFIAAITYSVYGAWVYYPNPKTWNIGAKLLSEDRYYWTGIPNFVVANIDTWELRLLFGYCYVIVFSSYGITIVANIKVWRYIESKKESLLPYTKDLHRQMTKNLCVQAMIPFLICMVPLAACVTTAFLHLNTPGLLLYSSLMWCWMPVANPIITMYVIRCYRRQIVNCVCFKRFLKITPSLTGRSWGGQTSSNTGMV